MTEEQSKKVDEMITKEENWLYLPYKNISGGFAEGGVFDYDEERALIEFKYGVENETGSTVHTEVLELDLETMKWRN